eukprot:jgi/Botrbrau1/23025/Bobra.136_1s0016.1
MSLQRIKDEVHKAAKTADSQASPFSECDAASSEHSLPPDWKAIIRMMKDVSKASESAYQPSAGMQEQQDLSESDIVSSGVNTVMNLTSLVGDLELSWQQWCTLSSLHCFTSDSMQSIVRDSTCTMTKMITEISAVDLDVVSASSLHQSIDRQAAYAVQLSHHLKKSGRTLELLENEVLMHVLTPVQVAKIFYSCRPNPPDVLALLTEVNASFKRMQNMEPPSPTSSIHRSKSEPYLTLKRERGGPVNGAGTACGTVPCKGAVPAKSLDRRVRWSPLDGDCPPPVEARSRGDPHTGVEGSARQGHLGSHSENPDAHTAPLNYHHVAAPCNHRNNMVPSQDNASKPHWQGYEWLLSLLGKLPQQATAQGARGRDLETNEPGAPSGRTSVDEEAAPATLHRSSAPGQATSAAKQSESSHSAGQDAALFWRETSLKRPSFEKRATSLSAHDPDQATGGERHSSAGREPVKLPAVYEELGHLGMSSKPSSGQPKISGWTPKSHPEGSAQPRNGPSTLGRAAYNPGMDPQRSAGQPAISGWQSLNLRPAKSPGAPPGPLGPSAFAKAEVPFSAQLCSTGQTNRSEGLAAHSSWPSSNVAAGGPDVDASVEWRAAGPERQEERQVGDVTTPSWHAATAGGQAANPHGHLQGIPLKLHCYSDPAEEAPWPIGEVSEGRLQSLSLDGFNRRLLASRTDGAHSVARHSCDAGLGMPCLKPIKIPRPDPYN